MYDYYYFFYHCLHHLLQKKFCYVIYVYFHFILCYLFMCHVIFEIGKWFIIHLSSYSWFQQFLDMSYLCQRKVNGIFLCWKWVCKHIYFKVIVLKKLSVKLRLFLVLTFYLLFSRVAVSSVYQEVYSKDQKYLFGVRLKQLVNLLPSFR